MRYADSYCKYTENYEPDHTYTFTGPCITTGKQCSVTVPAEGLYKYRRGAKMQEAFPGLSADEREFLMSGLSPEAWDKAFSESEDDT